MHKQKLWRNLSATTLAALLCLTPVANLYAAESNEPAKVVGNEDKTSNNEEKTVEAPKADEQKAGEQAKTPDQANVGDKKDAQPVLGQERTASDNSDKKEQTKEAKTASSETASETTAKATESQADNSALAKEQEKDANKYEKVWKTPVVVYGAALSIDEISRTREMFGLGNVQALGETSVDSSDLYQYLGSTAADSDMISSVAVQKREKGYGVRVKIVTPQNITQITDAIYTNAAISAGVHDCQIMVASMRPVTGESALTGVYKAFKLKGENFDPKQMQASQAELKTVNAINQSHIANPNYNPTSLDRAVLDTKLAIQSKAAKVGGKLASSEIAKLINENLNKYKIGNIVKPEQIEQLTQVFEGFQNTNALSSQVVREQLEILGNKLQVVFDQFYKDAVAAGFWDRIVKFINDVWQEVMVTVNNLATELSKKSA